MKKILFKNLESLDWFERDYIIEQENKNKNRQ